MFSLPLMIIFTDRKIFRQNPAQCPINFPPNKTIFWGKKNEFTPEQLHEIVNNTPEGQRLLQEKKRRLEEEAGGVSREDSRVASLAEKVDEDLVVVEASSVGGEENT